MAPTGDAYVDGYAIQVLEIWVLVPILLVVGFGLWKLMKTLWAAVSN